MDNETARALIALNNRFYQDNHESFSETRKQAWPGWERVATCIVEQMGSACRLIDVACGNLRFERYLAECLPACEFAITCLDSCAELVGAQQGVEFREVDVITSLLDGRGAEIVAGGPYDVAVSFGFMHHVPTTEMRAALLDALVSAVRPGGLVVASFWKFAEDKKLRERAQLTSVQGARLLRIVLGERDYLLGWNNEADAFRYCHSFTDDEIASLADSVSDRAEVLDRFNADGRNGRMNGYLVLRRR